MHGKKALRFQDLGIAMVRISPGSHLVDLVQFKMSESDPRWKTALALIEEFGAVDIAETEFTADELNQAQFLAMLPSWHHGYPQPEDDFGYLKTTYDLSSYCSCCGIGARQVAAFRLKKPPSWGTRSILQCNWIFDEYFVKPEIWQSIFAGFGIKNRPVAQDESGKVLDSVTQIDISDHVELLMEGRAHTQCHKCGEKVYRQVNGFFPCPAVATSKHVFKSSQWFGHGSNANRMVMVSQALYQKIQTEKIRGVHFAACLPPR